MKDTQNVSDTPDSHENCEAGLPPTRTESAVRTADNMKDLNAFEFNSADDVRLAIKANVYDTNMPSNFNDDDCVILQNKTVLTNRFKSKEQATEPESKPGPSKPKPRRKLKRAGVRRGPSRKSRWELVDAMYIGKLSNVVPFKRKRFYGRRADSDSDADSLLYSSS